MLKSVFQSRIRYVNSGGDSNAGFTEKEIYELEMQAGTVFPYAYRSFLSVAGKKANMLNEDYYPNNTKDPFTTLLTLQADLKQKLEKYNGTLIKEGIWCFTKQKNNYYFLYTTGNNNNIYCFSDEYFAINNGWTEVYGNLSKQFSFTEFINFHTGVKFGRSEKQIITSCILFIPTIVMLAIIAIFGFIIAYLIIKPVTFIKAISLKK